MKFSTGLRGLLLAALAAGLRAEENPATSSAKSDHWLVDAMAEKTANARDDSKQGAAAANASRAYAKPDDGAANPLSSYLATWMTPRDIEILKIKGTDANTPGGTTVAGQDRMTARAPAATSRANPYLTDPTPEPPVSAKNPPVPAPPGAPVSLSTPAPAKEAATAKTPGPPADLRKAQDDAKYFRQLKRF